MEEKAERELFKSAKETIVKWLLTFFLTSSVGLTAWYFNTNAVIAQNTDSIRKIELEIKKVTTVPVLNQNKIQNIEKELQEFKLDVKANQKENRESTKEMRKQLQKITELLFQIKQQND